MKDLDAIFSPQAVAVVGASTTPGKVGHDIFVNILKGGFTGTLYPVNPKAKAIAGVRAYPSVADIPDEIDLAMIILPPHLAVKAIDDAIHKGVKGVVVVSAGFREVGSEGRAIEDRIVAMCREAGVRMVGPNCLGVVYAGDGEHAGLNTFFIPEEKFKVNLEQEKNVAILTQSGAAGIMEIYNLRSAISPKAIVSYGN